MKRERGQAFILVLILLAVGALLITPCLQITSTALKSRAIQAQFIKNDYAADAGVEYGLWRLRWEPDFADSLAVGEESDPFSVTVNGITVTTTITAQAPEGLSDVGLAKNDQIKPTKEVIPDTASPGVPTTFTYTITLQRLEPDDAAFKPLESIKDAMEPGFSYVPDSSALDGVPFEDDDLTILKEPVLLNPITTLFVGPDADTMVTGVPPTLNYGVEETMDVGSGVPDPSHNVRSFVKFNLSCIPTGTVLQSATLKLFAKAVPSVTRTYNVHRVTENWTETSVNWDNQPAVAAAATANVTTPHGKDNFMEWDVRADVQDWLDNIVDNNGWRVSDVAEGSATPYQTTFLTMEKGDTNKEPKLEVAYMPTGGSEYLTFEWKFEPKLDFTYGQKRTLSFQARATLDNNTRYWNALRVKPEDSYSGLTAPITVGTPPDDGVPGMGITVTKTVDPSIIYPEVPTLVTYVISITNSDIGDFDKLDFIEDYLPPGFSYIEGSASAAWPDYNSPDNPQYPYNIGDFEPDVQSVADGRLKLKWHNEESANGFLPGVPLVHDFPMPLGTTYTQTFQAIATLEESGTYQNEVFVKLKDWNRYGDRGLGDQQEAYTWPAASVIVPSYDLLSGTDLATLRVSAQFALDGIKVRSYHWKKHK